jgi:Spy/CpxP family protein refolding chaperone
VYKIRKKPILDPGAMMHQWAGTGIWHRDTLKNTQKQQHKKVKRNKRNRNLQSSRHNDVEAVNQLFGANKVEIKQKMLEALRLLRQADHALNKVCKRFDNLTEDV